MKRLGEKLVNGLKDLADAARDGTILEKFRVHKVMRNDDGTFKCVTSDPEKGITVIRKG